MKIVVTGGAGFIGSNFLLLQVRENPQHEFVNVDRLTYAGNLANLAPIAECPNYRLRVMDIADADEVRGLFEEELPDAVIHFAAESHVDRSIYGPSEFVRTNVWGTFTLLEECRKQWKTYKNKCFLHVSTDEVYGSLGWEGSFTEDSRYDPSSPYSASKASSDHLVRAYGRTYGLPIKITNCSNNYGPRQFPEKLIPLMILNALEGRDLPVYGEGKNVRDWLYVEDHCEALWLVFNRGRIGETYNVGGGAEMSNLQVVHEICRAVADLGSRSYEELTSLIRYVPDRPGHDLRYSICADKISHELGWAPCESFLTGLRKTVEWYIANPDWVQDVRSGHYRDWLQQHYGKAD